MPLKATTSSMGRRQRVSLSLISSALLWVLATLPTAATTYAYRPKVGICGAAADGDVKKVEAHLKANPAAVHERDHDQTPLHWAASYGQADVVNLLILHNADVNAASGTGRTPLHAAYNNAQITRVLLTKQANPNAKTKDGETALLRACSYNRDPEVVRLLLENKADPNMKNDSNVTPLQSAAFHGIEPIVELLLLHGADFKAKGFRGATALHWAADGQKVKVVKLLMDKGADLNALDDDGKTPLAWAKKRYGELSWWKRLDIVSAIRLLRKAGAKE